MESAQNLKAKRVKRTPRRYSSGRGLGKMKSDKRQRRNLTLTDHDIAIARVIGMGNASMGVSIALRQQATGETDKIAQIATDLRLPRTGPLV